MRGGDHLGPTLGPRISEALAFVGHAFGNRVARMVATEHPDVVAGVVCLAAGGAVAPSREATDALVSVFDESLSSAAHVTAVAAAFFSPGNDPAPFLDGWHSDVAAEHLADTAGEPVKILDVPRAGHALLPEKPAAVATAILGWLSRQAAAP